MEPLRAATALLCLTSILFLCLRLRVMQVGGRQHDEFLLQLAGVGGFNDQPAVGPFGTIANPVRIYSSFHSRIAGCKGGDDSKHRLMWFELKAGPKHVCTECGQVFKLVTPNDGAASNHH